MASNLRSVTVFVVSLAWAAPAAGAVETDLNLPTFELEPEHGYEIVQNRKYQLDHEIGLWVGTLPLDPYTKGLTFTLGYTLHASDLFAIDLQGTYASNFDTNLRREVFRIATATSSDLPNLREIRAMGAIHLLMKPLYGKQALFNTTVVHFEGYVQAGAAVPLTCTTGLTGLTEVRNCEKLTVEFGFDAGVGFRSWISESWSLRFDINEIVYFPIRAGGRLAIEQALHLRLGIAVNLRGAE